MLHPSVPGRGSPAGQGEHQGRPLPLVFPGSAFLPSCAKHALPGCFQTPRNPRPRLPWAERAASAPGCGARGCSRGAAGQKVLFSNGLITCTQNLQHPVSPVQRTSVGCGGACFGRASSCPPAPGCSPLRIKIFRVILRLVRDRKVMCTQHGLEDHGKASAHALLGQDHSGRQHHFPRLTSGQLPHSPLESREERGCLPYPATGAAGRDFAVGTPTTSPALAEKDLEPKGTILHPSQRLRLLPLSCGIQAT